MAKRLGKSSGKSSWSFRTWQWRQNFGGLNQIGNGGIFMGSSDPHGIFMEFYGIFMGFHGIFMGFHGIFMGFHGIFMGCSWDFMAFNHRDDIERVN